MKLLCRIFAAICLLAAARNVVALDRTLYIVNGLAETLSEVNLETGAVANNTALLGLAPNQIFIDNVYRRDTIAYVTNSTSSDVQMVNLNTHATVKTIPLGADRNPYSLAFIDDSLAAVTNLLSGTITEINTRAGTAGSEYAVGLSPEGVICHDGLLYVCLTAFDFNTFTYGQGQVAVVDPALDSVVARIDVGTNPQSALVDYEGDLLVLCTGDFFSSFGQIYVVDPTTNTVIDSVATGGSPGHFALSPYGEIYIAAGGWVTNGEVYVFDSHTHTMLRDAADPISVGQGASAIATDLKGFVYSCNFAADNVSKIDQSAAVVDTYAVGDGPGFAAVYEPYPPGDTNFDGVVTAADVVMLVNEIFKGLPLGELWIVGDTNQSCTLSAADIINVVNYVFKSGPKLHYGCF